MPCYRPCRVVDRPTARQGGSVPRQLRGEDLTPPLPPLSLSCLTIHLPTQDGGATIHLLLPTQDGGATIHLLLPTQDGGGHDPPTSPQPGRWGHDPPTSPQPGRWGHDPPTSPQPAAFSVVDHVIQLLAPCTAVTASVPV